MGFWLFLLIVINLVSIPLNLLLACLEGANSEDRAVGLAIASVSAMVNLAGWIVLAMMWNGAFR